MNVYLNVMRRLYEGLRTLMHWTVVSVEFSYSHGDRRYHPIASNRFVPRENCRIELAAFTGLVLT